MKITDISLQVKDPNRVNISVDGKYRFSLDILQVGELGLKVGKEYTDEELTELETESQYGKLYARALEYVMMRPHSGKEVRDYLWRKTRPTRRKDGQTREGVSVELTERVYRRLIERGHIDDEAFARYWVENRHQTKGISRRKLIAELRSKGVDMAIIEQAAGATERDDRTELMKVLHKKRSRYSDDAKLIQYLMRQGFAYDDVRDAVNSLSEE